MKIYIVYLFDSGILTAFRSEEKAINRLWSEYLYYHNEEYLAKYEEEDKASLETYGYIIDFGSVEQTFLEEE